MITLEFMETLNMETHPGVLCPCDVLKVRWSLLHFITAVVRQAQFFYCLFFSLCFTMLIYNFVSLYISFISSSRPFSFVGFCLLGWLFFFSFNAFLFWKIHQNQNEAHTGVIDFITISVIITDWWCQGSQLNLLHSVCIYKMDLVASQEFHSSWDARRKGTLWVTRVTSHHSNHLPVFLSFARKDCSSSGSHCIKSSLFFHKPHGGRSKDS